LKAAAASRGTWKEGRRTREAKAFAERGRCAGGTLGTGIRSAVECLPGRSSLEDVGALAGKEEVRLKRSDLRSKRSVKFLLSEPGIPRNEGWTALGNSDGAHLDAVRKRCLAGS